MWRFWRSHGLRHRLQQSAEIAVGGDYSGRVFLKRSAHHIEAAKKRIKLLRIRWIECCCIDRSRFGVGFPFNLERVLRRGRTDRRDVAFLLAADVRRLTASLGTEPRSDLMSLARHALDNLLRNRWIVFAALETFVEQFDSEIGNFLPGAFRNLFLNFAAPGFNVGNCAGQKRAAFLQLLVPQRLSPFRYPNDFHKIMRGDGGAGLAAEDVIEARKRAALVIEPIVVEEWVADPPPGEAIDNDVELILGRAFSRWPVPGQDAFIEAVHLVDHRQLDLQSWARDGANDFAKTRDDDVFVLMNNEQ